MYLKLVQQLFLFHTVPLKAGGTIERIYDLNYRRDKQSANVLFLSRL
jgi:hypothetical protein